MDLIHCVRISAMNKNMVCPYKIGDIVCFCPSERTRGHYQDIENFGLRIGEEVEIKFIKDGVYLYFENGGGWPWTEFKLVTKDGGL